MAWQHGQELARHTRARIPHRHRHHHHPTSSKRPHTNGSGNVTVNPGTPTGRQSSGSSATPSAHPTCISHTRRSRAHRRAFQTRRQHRRGPARHVEARVPHHRERAHRSHAWQQGGIAPLQPRLSHLRRPQGSHHTPFEHQGAIATMRERRNHHHARAARSPHLIHHHTGDTSGRRFRQGPSPQALRLGPWPMREVRGSVAKIEVGPWAPGHFYLTVYSTVCASGTTHCLQPF